MISRRRLLRATAAAILAAPLSAEAQQAGKVWRIGWLSNVPPTEGLTAWDPSAPLPSALRQLGYVEGQNLAMEYRWAEGAPDRLAEFATELVRLEVDVILAIGPVAIRAAKQATGAIPIVMMTSGDPVGLGFVGSLARPGGNVTGVSFLGEQLSGKLLELLKQVVPRASRVAVLWNPSNGTHVDYLREMQAAARPLGVTIQSVDARAFDDLDRAFGRITRERADAIIMLLDPLFTANLRLIAEFAAKSRLPTIYALRVFMDAGGLMSYGPSLAELWKRAASYVDKILKGAKPADLPIEQPTKFELVINMKTAKALGLTIPQSLLLRADEVIQ